MESAKNQKLSLEEPDPETGFQTSVTESSENPDDLENHFVPLQGDYQAKKFGLPHNFWELLSRDPGLKQEFDQLIDGKVNEILGEREKALQIKVTEEATLEGLNLGRIEAKLELEKQVARIDQFCAELKKDKIKVLREHEKLWAEAFGHLLNRFLVPHGPEKAELLQRWLSESVERFAASKKVRVYFSPDDLQLIQQNSPIQKNERWEYLTDATLKPGEIHCECDAGGIFFSPDTQKETLDALIEQFKRTLDIL